MYSLRLAIFPEARLTPPHHPPLPTPRFRERARVSARQVAAMIDVCVSEVELAEGIFSSADTHNCFDI